MSSFQQQLTVSTSFQQLTVSTYSTFLVAFKVILLAYGDAGKSLSRHLSMQPVVKPKEILMKDWLQIKFPTLVKGRQEATHTTRRSSLHIPSVRNASDDDSSIDPFAQLESNLEDSLTTRQRFDLSIKFDTYIEGLDAKLDEIFAKCFSEWFSAEVIIDIKADKDFDIVSEQQDVYDLFTLVRKICLRLAGDKEGQLLDQIRQTMQLSEMTFSQVKVILDGFFETLEIYKGGIKLENQYKVRSMLDALNPYFYEKEKLEYHSLAEYPAYPLVCQRLQQTEDAAKKVASDKMRFSAYAPPVAPTSLLMAGAPPLRSSSVMNDRGTFGDYRQPHCPHCVLRTGNYYPHKAAQCHNPQSGSGVGRVPKKEMAAMVAQYHAGQATISRATFENAP